MFELAERPRTFSSKTQSAHAKAKFIRKSSIEGRLIMDVSIVICTRNRANRLDAMLESLEALRTSCQWEGLLVDNASTDDTPSILKQIRSKRIRCIHEPRVGLGAARDGAWRKARGDIICFTDDDCYPSPDFIDAMMLAFAEHPNAGCIGGRILLYDHTDAYLAVDYRTEEFKTPPYSFVYPGILQGANLAFRREALEKSGGFDPEMGSGTLYPAEDLEAVAAVIWSGYEAWFDPRPVIYHHHGRKEADVPATVAGYDRGRGAFYAKFIARPDTKRLFIRKWITLSKHNPHYPLLSLIDEIKSALRYAGQFQGIAAQMRIVGIGAAMLAVYLLSKARLQMISLHRITRRSTA